MNSLNDKYWSDRYKNNETNWDLETISPPLKNYIDQLTNKNIKILIPGCGNAYEAQYLIDNGFENITLVDISKTLVDQLKIKFKNYIKENKIKIIHKDFFTLDGKYDLILEQTFFCALTKNLRQDYVNQCHHLLNQNGKIVGLLFNKEFENNPPFGGSKEEYKNLFKDYFQINTLEKCYNSVGPRQGDELFINFSK